MTDGTQRHVLAVVACALATILFITALAGAVRVDLPDPAAPVHHDPDGAPLPPPALDQQALLLAVESDPFRADRQRSAFRYRLPGDVDPEPEPPPPPAPTPPDFMLRGTALSATGSSALIQVGDATPLMIAEGQHVLGYRLERVSPTSATLSGAAGVVTIDMPPPAQQIAVQETAPRGRERDARAQTARERAQIQQLLRRAREAGMPPQTIQSLMRMIEQRGIGNLGEIEFGPNGTMVMRRPPVNPDTTRTR